MRLATRHHSSFLLGFFFASLFRAHFEREREAKAAHTEESTPAVLQLREVFCYTFLRFFLRFWLSVCFRMSYLHPTLGPEDTTTAKDCVKNFFSEIYAKRRKKRSFHLTPRMSIFPLLGGMEMGEKKKNCQVLMETNKSWCWGGWSAVVERRSSLAHSPATPAKDFLLLQRFHFHALNAYLARGA
jgi:hypothetical protein